MAASLSAYWVKFFNGAGFPMDVATKHAVVFSNNRIKPDMLPELDKPSLKEMGITLMGDMIAILRYAKKVVEETTCERFLVDTEDDKPPMVKALATKSIVKKVAAKGPIKNVAASKPKIVQETIAKPAIKSSTSTTITKGTIIKKKIPPATRVVSQINKESSQMPVKRKLSPVEDDSDDSNSEDDDDDEWSAMETQKRPKLPAKEEKVGYTVIMPKGRTTRSLEILKKINEQKRTVFDRLGDSSVTSTTNLPEASPTFNITGLGNDILKRNSSVFNRLGDKDGKKNDNQRYTSTGILKNGTSNNSSSSGNSTPQGILKTRPSPIGSTTITLKKIIGKISTNKSTGTMHADHEKSQKSASSSVKQLVRTTKKIRLDDSPAMTKLTRQKNVGKISNPASKLASERVCSVPAKARLGHAGNSTTKQVTFNRVTKVAHIQKPGVFSRLGI